MGYKTDSGTEGKGLSVLTKELTVSGSGELDNGWTFYSRLHTLVIQFDNVNSRYFTLTMGSMGTIKVWTRLRLVLETLD